MFGRSVSLAFKELWKESIMGLSSGINPSASVVLKKYIPFDWFYKEWNHYNAQIKQACSHTTYFT
jgi:hypothetical protein